ncbi:hypothetical protein [Candidatus Cyanaurora vandensis]|uniref:hypothetical protein n=1 Tax=Candidatus Cyanaurora vandensis TaxID=2714958 RepID=UPI00257B8492|nr:hypothetical protein [Candidatus Cyanaurora vandensis]
MLEIRIPATTVPTATQPLTYHDSYPCPVCRHGQISALLLMEAFACNFCRHIFTCVPEQGLVRVEDSAQPLTWRWAGKWQAVPQEDLDITLVIWGVGLALVFLPPLLVFFSCWSWNNTQVAAFILSWTLATFVVHFCLIAWMLAEHYQLAPYVASKVLLRDWFER